MSGPPAWAVWAEVLRELPDVAAGLGPRLPAIARQWWSGPAGRVQGLARRRPNALALAGPDGRWTWRALWAQIDATARFWRAQGVGAGDTVALLLGNRAEAIILPLALSRLGASAALVHPTLTGAALTHALRTARAKALVVDGPRAGALAGLDAPLARLAPAGAWCAGPGDADLPDLAEAVARAPAGRLPRRRARPDDVLLYLFTSGTTGLPKAAPITLRRFLLPGLAFQGFALGARPHDVLFTPLPLCHASAWIVGYATALVAGAGFAWAERFSASRYWADAEAVGATIGLYVGELCRYLVDQPPRPDDGAHGVHTFVGNGLRGDVWPRFQARFGGPRVVEFYGATEGNALLINRNGKPGACGRPVLRGPLNGLRLVRHDADTGEPLRDGAGRLVPCAVDEPGELIGRIGVLPSERFDGYLDPAATAQKILRDGLRAGDAWFRTGDLLRCDADGDYTFVDRLGDTFRWKGENISTQAVAEALAGAPGVEASAVYGVTVPGHEGRAGLWAVVAQAPLDWAALYQRTEALAPAARPVFVRVVPTLAVTDTLKVKVAPLRAEGIGPDVGDPLWVRDTAQGRYRPLDDAARAALASGALRL